MTFSSIPKLYFKGLSMKYINLTPSYYGYQQGTYDNVNYCTECNVHGLYEDIHSVNPCPLCGGKIKEGKVGKWIQVEYITDYLFKIIPIRKRKVTNGYWLLKENR